MATMPEPTRSEPVTTSNTSELAGAELTAQETGSHAQVQASLTQSEIPAESTGLVMAELSGVEPIKSGDTSAPFAAPASGEASRGHKAVPYVWPGGNKAQVAREAKTPTTLEPLTTGLLTERPMFAAFGSDYCFPPKPSAKASEGPRAQGTSVRGPDSRGSLGKPAPTSESQGSASSGPTMPLTAQPVHREVAPSPESQSSTRRNSVSTVVSPDSASERRPRCRDRSKYTTTCECDQNDEAIACAKKGQPVPPPPVPKLYLPRALAEVHRCPSCDREYEALGQVRTEKERLVCIIEEHWPCVVHLMLTDRVEPAFADE